MRLGAQDGVLTVSLVLLVSAAWWSSSRVATRIFGLNVLLRGWWLVVVVVGHQEQEHQSAHHAGSRIKCTVSDGKQNKIWSPLLP